MQTFYYDALDRLVRRQEADSSNTYFEYNHADTVAKVTDPRGRPTTYAYDGFGLLRSQTSPDTGTTSLQYNTLGQHTGITRPSGSVITYSYDAIGRKVTAVAGGQTQSFAYDSCNYGKGKVCSVSDPTGSVTYAYNPQGRVVSQVSLMPSSGGATYTYSYDAIDRLVGSGYPGGVGVGYGYANGRLRAVTARIDGVDYNVATNLQYQPFGPVKSWTFGNGLTRGIAYDLDGRVTELNTKNGASFVQRLAYLYSVHDEVSKITDGVNAALTQTYAFDRLSRLTSVTATGANEAFTWDATGNRLSHVWGGATDSYTIASQSNRLSAITGTRATNYTYDANGNTISGEGATFTYGPFNRLATATKSGIATSYSINALGQRVYKKVGTGAHHWFTYSAAGQMLGEFQGVWMHYVRLPDGAPLARIKSGQLIMIHTDHLGRPELVTNSAKAVVWRASNFAFDRTATLDSIGGLNLGFPGQYFDVETGAWYNYFRTYNPRTGRYLESDPIGIAGGLNTYAYAGGNPISFFDTLGLASVTVSFYRGRGGSITLGYEGGRWFGRVGTGFGIGGGIKYNPTGKLPLSPTRGSTERAFIGASGSIGASFGPASAELKGQAGLVVTKCEDGKPYLEYIEEVVGSGSFKGNAGWGFSLGGGINIYDVGAQLPNPGSGY